MYGHGLSDKLHGFRLEVKRIGADIAPAPGKKIAGRDLHFLPVVEQPAPVGMEYLPDHTLV
jgi:hypothetical protein